MTILQEEYVRRGHKLDKLERMPIYLSQLSLMCAAEIRAHLLGRASDFGHTKELADILKRHHVVDPERPPVLFPYPALWKAIEDNSEKRIADIPQFALEMKLLTQELDDVPKNPGRLPDLAYFLDRLDTEFFKERFFVY